MAEKRSEASRYPSRYSPKKWVTGAQYIIELVCEQKAKYENKDLPVQFWHQKEWAKFFSSQTRATHRLLKLYSEKAIINVVKRNSVRTLMPKWVVQVIAAEQKKLDALKAQADAEKPEQLKPDQPIIQVPKRRVARFGASELDKLLVLENGEEKERES